MRMSYCHYNNKLPQGQLCRPNGIKPRREVASARMSYLIWHPLCVASISPVRAGTARQLSAHATIGSRVCNSRRTVSALRVFRSVAAWRSSLALMRAWRAPPALVARCVRRAGTARQLSAHATIGFRVCDSRRAVFPLPSVGLLAWRGGACLAHGYRTRLRRLRPSGEHAGRAPWQCSPAHPARSVTRGRAAGR